MNKIIMRFSTMSNVSKSIIKYAAFIAAAMIAVAIIFATTKSTSIGDMYFLKKQADSCVIGGVNLFFISVIVGIVLDYNTDKGRQ